MLPIPVLFFIALVGALGLYHTLNNGVSLGFGSEGKIEIENAKDNKSGYWWSLVGSTVITIGAVVLIILQLVK